MARDIQHVAFSFLFRGGGYLFHRRITPDGFLIVVNVCGHDFFRTIHHYDPVYRCCCKGLMWFFIYYVVNCDKLHAENVPNEDFCLSCFAISIKRTKLID